MDYENEEYNWMPFLDVDAPFPNQVSPFATSLESTIQTLFSMIEINKGDVILDIGSGDGRIVFYASENFNVRAIGIDINPELVDKSNAKAKSKNIDHQVSFLVQNFLDSAFDWSFKLDRLKWNKEEGVADDKVFPTVLTMYLLPEAIELLYPKLEEYVAYMHKNNNKARIVSIFFKLERWSEWLHSTSEKNNVFLYIK